MTHGSVRRASYGRGKRRWTLGELVHLPPTRAAPGPGLGESVTSTIAVIALPLYVSGHVPAVDGFFLMSPCEGKV